MAEALHQRENHVIISDRRKDRLTEVAKAKPGMAWVELNIEDPVNISAVAANVIAEYPDLNIISHRLQFRFRVAVGALGNKRPYRD